MAKKSKYVKRYLIIDESRKIEGIRGFSTKKKAEEERIRLVKERSKRGAAIYNREFNRSKNLKVVRGLTFRKKKRM